MPRHLPLLVLLRDPDVESMALVREGGLCVLREILDVSPQSIRRVRGSTQ